MDFIAFLIVNAMLFIRPAEFAPALLGLPVYEVCIVACILLSAPVLLPQLSLNAFKERPVSACVLGLLPLITISQVINGQADTVIETTIDFIKVLLYYFLLVGLVNTPARLTRLLSALAMFGAAVSAMAVLHYHGMIEVPALRFEETGVEDAEGALTALKRLGSTGLFQDPNDMCLMLVLTMMICLYQIIERKRFYWALPLGLFGHALTLTHSRGGFLGLLIALGTFLLARFGKKALPLGLLVVPVVFVLFAGRQTDISLNSGTGQSRIQLWHEGMTQFILHPLFGIGYEQYAEVVGQVAHNSFIHCFTELGFLGGTLFLGAFLTAFWPIWKLGPATELLADDSLRRVRPYILAILCGYGGGLLSLSCSYTIPTYLVLGLATVYQRLASDDLGQTLTRFDGRLAQRLAFSGAVFITMAFVYVRLAVH